MSKHHSTTHGERYANKGKPTPEYGIWSGIKKRILCETYHQFEYYGGRGIDMDPRWNTYENFLSDVGRRPTKSHSLDRIDNSKGYWKDNVRWATKKEQMRNTRYNVLVDWLGYETCLAEACEELGWVYKTVHAWHKYKKLSFEEIKEKADRLWVKGQTSPRKRKNSTVQ